MSAIGCVITAAGLSSRMGQWKMMLPRQQGTTLDTSIRNALQLCNRVILVTGYRGNELHERYANQSNITIIHNPDYTQSLLTSVKAAVPTIQTEHCFLTYGDVPVLTIDIFRRIWSLRNDDTILPLHNYILGHPILVPEPCLMQAIQRPNTINMCQTLPVGAHYSVETENAEVILDIDTPDDFTTAQKRYAKIQKMQLNGCAQIFNLSNILCHNDKESLILRKEKK